MYYHYSSNSGPQMSYFFSQSLCADTDVCTGHRCSSSVAIFIPTNSKLKCNHDNEHCQQTVTNYTAI